MLQLTFSGSVDVAQLNLPEIPHRPACCTLSKKVFFKSLNPGKEWVKLV